MRSGHLGGLADRWHPAMIALEDALRAADGIADAFLAGRHVPGVAYGVVVGGGGGGRRSSPCATRGACRSTT